MFNRQPAEAVVVASNAGPAATVTAAAPRAAEKSTGGGVEVASLSLRAILEKLPPDLRAIINQLPDPSVKIVLPINTILKQLPTGAVRMSLASLLRQAPQGTFKKTVVEEKQMVDVPLGEVFKNVDATRLGRRSDQRRYDVPDDAAGLFGRNGTTRSVHGGAEPAPAEAETPHRAIAAPDAVTSVPEPDPAPMPRIEPQKVMRMPGIAPAAPSPAHGNGHVSHAAPVAPAAPALAPKLPAAGHSGSHGELVISFVELASGWPEGIRSELSMLPGDTKLIIPASSVSAGLQKGKVSFPWSQVRMWLRPAMTGSPAIADDFELIFPLRIMAPAFVAATGATKRREAAEIDHSLPDFFGPTASAAAKTEQTAPEVAPSPEAAAPVVVEPVEPVPTEPEPAVAPLKFTIVREEPVPMADALPPATPVEVPTAEIASSPAEIVTHACRLPGVAGAVVALEEGLVIAQNLPDGFSADTFAAFMPQIFGRLEKYTAEMQLGAATEITIQSAHGPCHIARRGKLYFGTLGHAGERLPESLDILANQLAAHNS